MEEDYLEKEDSNVRPNEGSAAFNNWPVLHDFIRL